VGILQEHLPLPYGELQIYAEMKEKGQRAQRRCTVCGHKTAFYCGGCSSEDTNVYVSVCSLTNHKDKGAKSCWGTLHQAPTDV
jgi:hypothetical protein